MKYDVIVVGGGPGGIPAAVAAKRMGMKTLLVERSAVLGGLAISGLPILGFIDHSGRRVLGGIAEELMMRLKKVGAFREHVRCPVHNSLALYNHNWMRIECFELCREEGVDLALYSDLMSVKVDNGRVCGITVLCRGEIHEYECRILIDATGDGVAAYMAGARYQKSRKLQPGSLTFTMGHVDIPAVLAYMKEHPETIEVTRDYEVHQNLSQFDKGWGFTFIGFSEFIREAQKNGEYTIPRDRIVFSTLPDEGEVMVNVTRVTGVDTSVAADVISAEQESHRQVKELVLFLKKYCPGFDKSYLSSLSYGFGARESRRIEGIRTLTVDALKDLEVPEDTIVLAGYNMDIHPTNTEQHFMQPVEKAIGIPYGCLVSNSVRGFMMAGRDISVDEQIFGLTRIMGTCMGAGEAAGTAAGMAIREGIEPADVDVQKLRRILCDNGCILE